MKQTRWWLMAGSTPCCPTSQQPATKKKLDLRDRSCRLRCSLRLKARLQYWHLYFFSGAEAGFLGGLVVTEVLAGSELVALSDWAIVVAQRLLKEGLELLRPGASLWLENELVQRV